MLALWLGTAALAGPQTLLVGVSDEASRTAVHQVGSARCWSPLCIVDVRSPEATAAALRQLPGIRYVERDRTMPVVATAHHAAVDGTAACPDLWELEQIGVEAVWERVGLGGAAPVVAIQDTGFLLSHHDLGSVSGQFDYGDGDTIPEVSWASGIPSHGTFIAGLIASPSDNDVGRVGVLPDGRLNLQKIADATGALYFSYAVSAMLDLADGDLGVRVLNYSIASSSTTAAFDDAVASLGRAGILLVAAAANCASGADCWDADNDSHPVYPANSPGEHIVSVAGSTRDDGLNPYSHYGATTVDLAAPGVELCSLGVLNDTDTYTSAGTSYATPLVAATAAAIWAAWPELDPESVARILRASVSKTAALHDKVRSDGRLSAARAMLAPLPTLEAPSRLSIDGETSLPVVVGSRAAAGTATILFIHGDAVSVSAPPDGWSMRTLAAGTEVALVDAGAHTVTAAATLLTGVLPADGASPVLLPVRGHRLGTLDATIRLVATSEGVDYLNAPYATGEVDETGFLALPVTLDIRAVHTPDEDSGLVELDTGASDSRTDTDTAAEEETSPPQPDAANADPAKRGCTTGPSHAPLSGVLAVLATIWCRRRRRDGGRTDCSSRP